MSGKKANNNPGLCPVKEQTPGLCSRARARNQFSSLKVVHTSQSSLPLLSPQLTRLIVFVASFFFLLALQPPLGVVFYSPLVGFSLLACEVS